MRCESSDSQAHTHIICHNNVKKVTTSKDRKLLVLAMFVWRWFEMLILFYLRFDCVQTMASFEMVITMKRKASVSNCVTNKLLWNVHWNWMCIFVWLWMFQSAWHSTNYLKLLNYLNCREMLATKQTIIEQILIFLLFFFRRFHLIESEHHRHLRRPSSLERAAETDCDAESWIFHLSLPIWINFRPIAAWQATMLCVCG